MQCVNWISIQWTVDIAKECFVDVGKFSSEGFSGDLGQGSIFLIQFLGDSPGMPSPTPLVNFDNGHTGSAAGQETT